MLYADSYVLAGTCKALVLCVGDYSTRGVVDTTYDTREKETELSIKLDNIAGSLKFLGLISSIVILGTSLLVLFLQTGVDEEVGGKIFTKKLIDCIIISLIMLIVAIPEGLPMTVAVSLAHSVLLMSKYDNVLVRDLDAVEEAGLITDVCFGKTGTMTTEDMSCVSFFAQNEFKLNSRKNTLENCELDKDTIEKIVESIVYNSQAYIEMTENSFYMPVGNGTEVSLIKWLQGAEIPVHEIMAQKENRILAQVPFNSKLKRSIIAIKHPSLTDTVRIYIKGAPEFVVAKCNAYYVGEPATTATGESYKEAKKEPLSEDRKAEILADMNSKMTQDSLRAIAFSYRDMNVSDFESLMSRMSGDIDSSEEISAFEENQTFLALVALKDPIRDNMKKMVGEAKDANIALSMISGDNLMTAAAVACDVGILSKQEFNRIKDGESSDIAMDASVFRQIVGDVIREQDDVEDGVEATTSYSLQQENQQAFNESYFGKVKVIGRADPEDKLRLIVALQGVEDSVRKVAVVGEGINDLDAFSAADVSFAVADGTSLARNSASMILQTNDFDSCMQAVKWGRNIYMNVRRFLQFQITCNLALLTVVMVSYCTLTESALNAVQLIYINLIMDIFGALALASTRPESGKVTYNAGDKVMTPHMYRQILGMALYMVTIMMVVMYAGKNLFGLKYSAST